MSRLAVVTGASRGIGRATAARLFAEGFDVAICARRPGPLAEAADAIRTLRPGGRVVTAVCDVADETQVAAFAKTCLAAGEVAVLVNNAGQFVPGGLLAGDGAALRQQLDVNLMSAYWLTRALVGGLRQNPGRGLVVNVCSVAGLAAYPPSGPYTVSKFALRGLGVALRDELKPDGIAVTNIFPGPTWSDSWSDSGVEAARLMTAEDIAEVVAALTRLSPRAVAEEIVLRPTRDL